MITPEQLEKLKILAEAARPHPTFPDGNRERDGGDDWGSERQIEAANAFHVFVSDDLGIDTEDMATAKASAEEMIDEALRRVEELVLCQEYAEWHEHPSTTAYPAMCARELQHELMAMDPQPEEHLRWLTDFCDRWERWEQWRPWHPKPAVAS